MNPLVQSLLFNRVTPVVVLVLVLVLGLLGLRSCACITSKIGKEEHEQTTDTNIPRRSDYESRTVPDCGQNPDCKKR